MTYMDYMDLIAHCQKKAVKLNRSLEFHLASLLKIARSVPHGSFICFNLKVFINLYDCCCSHKMLQNPNVWVNKFAQVLWVFRSRALCQAQTRPSLAQMSPVRRRVVATMPTPNNQWRCSWKKVHGFWMATAFTENQKFSWCQLCHHWWHWRLSVWQPPVLPVMTKLASWQLLGFCVYAVVSDWPLLL